MLGKDQRLGVTWIEGNSAKRQEAPRRRIPRVKRQPDRRLLHLNSLGRGLGELRSITFELFVKTLRNPYDRQPILEPAHRVGYLRIEVVSRNGNRVDPALMLRDSLRSARVILRYDKRPWTLAVERVETVKNCAINFRRIF